MIKAVNSCILAQKPIKNMPKGLIYNHQKTNNYKLIETKTGKVVGEMLGLVIKDDDNLYNKGKNTKLFYIESLDIETPSQGKGWGKYFLDFAKKESFQKGCEGRLALLAYNAEKSPHVFYIKQGLITRKKEDNIILRNYAQKNCPVYYWEPMDMYLPEYNIERSCYNFNKQTEQKSLYHRVLEHLKQLFGF